MVEHIRVPLAAIEEAVRELTGRVEDIELALEELRETVEEIEARLDEMEVETDD